MPRHTTRDPAKRAFHIANREAEAQYQNGDVDFFQNAIDAYDSVLPILAEKPTKSSIGKFKS